MIFDGSRTCPCEVRQRTFATLQDGSAPEGPLDGVLNEMAAHHEWLGFLLQTWEVET